MKLNGNNQKKAICLTEQLAVYTIIVQMQIICIKEDKDHEPHPLTGWRDLTGLVDYCLDYLYYLALAVCKKAAG